MRILFLTQWFDPEPTFKGLSFARALQKRGHEVEVLTGFPNYPEGKLYTGYELKLFRREVMDGIQVVRVPLYPSHDRSRVRRAANYVSFALAAAVLGPLLVQRADVAYVYHPPATIALPASFIRLIRGIPIVFDIQDLWPDTLSATGMVRSSWLLRLAGVWCRLEYRMARGIAVLSPGFKRRLVERGVPAEKIEVIYNWCDEATIGRAPRDEALAAELGLAGRFNVVFAGTMGPAQALEAVLASARIVGEQDPSVQFVFMGSGMAVDRLKELAAEMALKNVRFLPRRPYAAVAKVLNLADVLLVHLRDDPLFEITIPSKTQAYMAVGKPILMAVKGDAAALVERAGAGMVCAPENPEGLAAAVARLRALPRPALEAMGENGRRFYERELSMSVAVSRFEGLLHTAAGAGRAKRSPRPSVRGHQAPP